MLNIAYVSAILQIMRRSVFITVLLLFCLVTTVHSECVTYDKFVVTPAVINGAQWNLRYTTVKLC